ncbi:M23 family metallopeptidase [Kineothrix sp. MB12-C1]|uniref:M23 family metallopeptidase n=1 Tax=Kineothrix sp. MB12-C1 TaxID=3070215 RepID=UPI0027D202C0|nr:M23 family metallopeptidase [Kineothrix sp. MB12-C1]WMC93763.1 M23 family metallopeptidase [Kineothrix sp. MB12-C1]
MQYLKRIKKAIIIEGILLFGFAIVWASGYLREGIYEKDVPDHEDQAIEVEVFAEKKFIKWVDFNITYEALCEAYKWDVETYQESLEDKSVVHVDWIELLAYVGTKHGGSFPSGSVAEIRKTAEKLKTKEATIKELTKDMEYYAYYLEAYTAVLDGFVGEYEIQKATESGAVEWQKCYGLKAFSPVAKGFAYNDYDDFGTSRSYGYSRPHLGHDMMGQTGTPIIAIESGYVEAIGWNQYGGWRLGIRSFDGKRYYYYAHLRQNFPYFKELEEGSVVTAGQVIGYMGHTGYSTKENVNNIKVTHLHWGLQLIFDESQKEGNNEIWIDCYQLTKFLYKNRSETMKNEETKEWYRIYEMKDPAVDAYVKRGNG